MLRSNLGIFEFFAKNRLAYKLGCNRNNIILRDRELNKIKEFIIQSKNETDLHYLGLKQYMMFKYILQTNHNGDMSEFCHLIPFQKLKMLLLNCVETEIIRNQVACQN